MTIPNKVYLTRGDVIGLVGGRRQLEKLERSGRLRRVPITGYKWAHYERAQVKRLLDDLPAAFS